MAHLASMTLPDPPLPGSEDIQPLTHLDEFLDEGRSMHNCVASYVPQVAAYRTFVYRVLRPERATLAIRFTHGRWSISELLADRNRPVQPATKRKVQGWIDELGGTRVPPRESPWRQPISTDHVYEFQLDDIPF
jgi:hypothetical protein